MKCFYHENTDAVAQCNNCGRGLCHDCSTAYSPPLCEDCAGAIRAEIKKSGKSTLVLYGVLLLAGLVFGIAYGNVLNGLMLGYGFAGIPAGWRALTKITPKMFLVLPIIGWLIYFGIKFFLACCIGVIMLPISVFKIIQNIKD